MTHQRNHERDHTRLTGHDAGDSAFPGRASAALQVPVAPVPSGIVMRKARDDNGVGSDAESAVASAASSSGSALPTQLQRKFESSLGTDLSSVRVHTSSESHHAAGAVGARAYTVGQDIHFGAGQYDPTSRPGQHLIAHEVAHTVQQRGGTPTRQNKLAVSAPQDHAELEADRAADAMVAGTAASFGGARLGIARDLDTEMDKEANNQGSAAASEAPMKITEMSSMSTVAEAKGCIKKIVAAQGNLNLRKATQEAAAKDAGTYSEEKQKLEKDVAQTGGFLSKNESVIGTLQKIVDLGQGNSQVDDKGVRPGHDMRLAVFAQLSQAALVDYGRLKGMTNAFLAANPNTKLDGDDKAAGGQIGTTVATGGKGSSDADIAKSQGQVQAAQSDQGLHDLIVEYKTAYESLSNDKTATNINTQLTGCASAVSKAKNVSAEIDLGTKRDDTPEQKAAEAEAAKVNASLESAKAAFDTIESVAVLAVSVMGMPELGVLGEGSALTPVIDKVAGNKAVQTTQKIANKASAISGGVGKVTGGDVQKVVSADIKTAIGKMVTNYEANINAADGHAKQANLNAKRKIVTLDTSKMQVAQGDVIAEYNKLSQICGDVEEKKLKLRAKAKEISNYQKKHKKPGQPDIGAITKVLAETAAFVKQADAAILQGDEEQKIAKEMVGERQKVVGDYKQTGIKDDFGKEGELGEAKANDVYTDCEPAPPHLLSGHPLRFQMRSEDAGQHVENTGLAVLEQLRGLKECREGAVAMEGQLKKVMGF